MKMAEETVIIPPDIAEMPFEKALEELEKLVSAMQNERLPMDKLIVAFERGNQLAVHCRSKLEEQEKRIEILTRSVNGAAEWKDMDTVAF